MTANARIAALLSLSLVAGTGAVLHAQAMFEETDLFVGGQDNINTYRIPALICTAKGTVLAFSEGREDRSMDGTPTDIVLKRSLGNGGKWVAANSGAAAREGRSRQRDMMWLPMQTLIHNRNGEAYMNPVPVIDRSDGTIFLLVNLYPQPYQDLPAVILLIKSTDEGATWTEPVDITAGTGKHELGPGDGIQLKSGRLIVQVYDGVVYSDDHGETWKSSGVAAGEVNETQVVELADGTVLFSRRNKPNRLMMTSEDHGETWSAPRPHPGLPDPDCQGSLIRYTREDEGYQKNRLLFSNPAGGIDPNKATTSDPRGRFNVTVRVSYDEGKTWPVAKLVRKGPGAYSTMTVFPDGTIGILYETGEESGGYVDHYGELVFARFNLEWLTDGKDHLDKKD
jgi:sialidase-1